MFKDSPYIKITIVELISLTRIYHEGSKFRTTILLKKSCLRAYYIHNHIALAQLSFAMMKYAILDQVIFHQVMRYTI